MVAIVTGLGLGLERSSGWVLGSRGQLGNAAFGRYGENVYVNAATGNLLINRTDEILLGQGPDDAIMRSYNSLANYTNNTVGTDDNNDNWRLSAQRQVKYLTGTVNTANSTVKRIDWDGSDELYTWNASWNNGAGAYVCMKGSGAYDTLTYASNVWTWTDGNSRVTDTYDNLNGGRITSTQDTDGNQLAYSYNSAGLLTRITTTDTSGTAEYTDIRRDDTNNPNNITSIITHLQNGTTLTRVSYTYYTDGTNRLYKVTTDLTPNDSSTTDGSSVVTTYTYDGTSNRVASISQTGGALLQITYDSSNRVHTLTQTISSGTTSTTTFNYFSGYTNVVDAQGQTTKLTYDANDQLTQIDLPPASPATAQVIKYTYNGNGDVLSATDGSGNTVNYEYDANGNLTLQHDAQGNTIRRTYDQTTNALLTETRYLVPDPDSYTASGVATVPVTTRYVYDSHNHLRFVVSALGEVTEYDYNPWGQQTSSITYRDNTYDISALNPTDTISEGALTSWAGLITDLSTVARTDMTYDFRGNISTVTTYSAANATTGAGLTNQPTTKPYTTITYVYDQYGSLLSRQTSGVANSEVFTYDGLGRLTKSVDLNNATTNISYTDGANTTVVTLANTEGTNPVVHGTQTSVYNDVGELISYAQVVFNSVTDLNQTATTNYSYDNLGHLRMVTDATALTSYYLYDAVGRKVADIAGDGSITEYGYDASDRLVKTISYATKLTSQQLASLVDANGNPTNVSLSSVRPTSNSGDLWTWRVYDNANRLIEVIDGNGDATVFAYDGISNLLSTTSYYNTLTNVASFIGTTPTSLQLPTANATKDNVTRNFYDNDGRLIGTLDGDGYLSQIVYNGAGQKIETTAYFNVSEPGNHSLRSTDTFAQLLQSVGNDSRDIYTRYYYDNRGLLRYTLDDNLRPTEFVYDSAEHLVETIDYGASVSAVPTSLNNLTSKISSQNLLTNVDTRTSWSVYDPSSGQLAYSIDAAGGVVSYTYDALGHVIKQVQYATPYTSSSSPTFTGMQGWATTANDRTTRMVYDLAGRLTYTVDAEGYVTECDYDDAGRKTLELRYADVYAVNDTVSRDSLAQLISSTTQSATPVSYKYSYDPATGRLSDSYDGLNVRTHLVYDALGRVISRTVAYNTSDAATVQYTYDAAGRVASETQASGTSDASITYYTYDGMGNMLTLKDGRGNTTTYTYDALGQVLTKSVPVDSNTAHNLITTYTYDAFGNVLTTTDPLGYVTYFFYDALNRLTLQVDADGYATATTYTIGNAIASVISYATAITAAITPGTPPTVPHNNTQDATTTFTRDKLDRVTMVTDAEGYFEQYTLDAFGDRVAVWKKSSTATIQQGGETINVFDRRGLLVSETLPIISTNPDGTVQATSVTNTFQYDARGNRIVMVEAAGLTEQRTTTYTYDKMDRLTKTVGDSVPTIGTDLKSAGAVKPTQTTTYDKRGNVIEVMDANGATTFYYYDDLNRKIAEVDAVGTLSAFSYDQNGNLLSQTVYGDPIIGATAGGTPPSPVNSSNCRQTTYIYDADNRLTTTTVASLLTGQYGTSYATSTSDITVKNYYDKDGNIVEQVDGNGNAVWYYYDKLGQKIAQVDQDLYVTTYALDADGNVTTETRFATPLGSAPGTPPTAALTNLPSTTTDDRVTNFTYDRNGRRLTEKRTGVVAWKFTGSAGALIQASTTSTITYTYNGLGEVISKKEATGDTTVYTYDAEGRLTNTTGPSFTDYTGATVQQSTDQYYDGLNNLTESVVNSTRVTSYTYGAGGRLASMTNADGDTFNYGYDAAGHVVKENYIRHTSANTPITEADAWQYDALGRVVLQSVATWNSGSTSWIFGDKTQTKYNAYGEVSARGINVVDPNIRSDWQETFDYDSGGRLWRSTANDGTVKLYLYDGDGNQTLEITSDGNALPSGYSWTDNGTLTAITLAQAIALLTNNNDPTKHVGDVAVPGMVVTITDYDARGQGIATIEPLRQIIPDGSTVVTATITLSRGYNAFGEVAQQTDGRGKTTTFKYNTMGKIIEQVSPLVSYTDEAGGIHDGQSHNNVTLAMVNPVQDNYYDISGRLIGVRDANNYSGAYDTANHLNTRTLLAGTGYDGSDALVLKEFHADGGIYQRKYDAFQDMIKEVNEVGKTETFTYDAMDRLIQVSHQTRLANTIGNDTGVNVTLVDHYVYDELGQRRKHWTNELGSSVTVEDLTDYDSQGRVISMVDMGGNTTTYAYAWDSGIATTGLGQFGGWTKTTTNPAGLAEIETTDYFGRTVDKIDFGNHNFNYTFNSAGQLVGQTNSAGQNLAYTYYNTGLNASVVSTYNLGGYGSTITSNFRYDAQGNRTYESDVASGFYTNYFGNTTVTYSVSHENATMMWDAMNRMMHYHDDGAASGAPVTIDWQYDLNGNIRRMTASYDLIDLSGALIPTGSEDYWYKYDLMNRFTVTEGALAGGTIGITPTQGETITYDLAGNRTSMTNESSGTRRDPETNQIFNWTGLQTEYYSYTTDGYLAEVDIGTVYSGIETPDDKPVTMRAKYVRDAMGRVTDYFEYDQFGANVYEHQSTYNNKSQVTSDTVMSVRTDGTWSTTTTYDYNATGTSGYNGAYMGGAVTHTHANTYLNGSWQTTSDTTNGFVWWDQALSNVTSYKPDTSQSTVNTSTYHYDANGFLQSVYIQDGRPRTVSFVTNGQGEILTRDETDNNTNAGDPHEMHYYFNGIQIGDISNNGTSDIDYAASIAQHTTVPGTGAFQNGAPSGLLYANFDQSYDPINGLNYQSTSTRYTVQAGDTLESIALQQWGDASFWYLIADSNGLSGSDTLAPGMDIILPNKVHNIHNDADTYRVYDPNKAMGNLSPTAPKPSAPKQGGCGIFGAIIEVIVSVVVSCFSNPVFGDAARQLTAMALGDQKSFNWGELAATALTATLTGFGGGTGNPVIDVPLAMARNAMTQGFELLMHAQKSFSFLDVAVAGVAAGVSDGVAQLLPGGVPQIQQQTAFGTFTINAPGASASFLNTALSGTAGLIAGAAMRTLKSGTDFGDNLIAVLPDVIGNTVGNAIGSVMTSGSGQTDNSTSDDAASFGAFLGQGEDFRAPNAADRTGMVQTAALPGSITLGSSNQGFFGWLGNELESGLNWVGNEIETGAKWVANEADAGANWVETKVSSGVTWAGQALGIIPEYRASNLETVVVTANAPAYKLYLVAEEGFIGHTFIGGERPNGSKEAYGFYPDETNHVTRFADSVYQGSQPSGLVRNDTRYLNDALKGNDIYAVQEFDVDKATYDKAMGYIKDYAKSNNYDVLKNSCATAALNALNSAGVIHSFIPGSGFALMVHPNVVYDAVKGGYFSGD